MPNRQLFWPQDKEAEAQAYRVWSDADGRNPFHPDPYAYCDPCKYQSLPGWVTPLLGPPEQFNGQVLVEPEGGEAMRAAAVIVEGNVEPPDEEE